MIAIKLALLGATLVSHFPPPTYAQQDCPCGYRTDDTSVYTEVLETDFRTVTNIASLTKDWQIQDWKVNLNTSSNIPLNRVAKPENVVAGNNKGLQMLVRAVKGLDVGVSEMRTARDDIKYGSFRVSMQTTSIGGTCSAFFWYQNDSCEIDVELLSKDVNPAVANFVIHSPQSSANGFDASTTDSFKRSPLPFNPTSDFHEYRFDWKPNSVDFSVDGQSSSSMIKNVPQGGGRVFLNHWSNGSPSWSGAAPTQDATTWVRYVRLYFNSSDPIRVNAADARCKAALSSGSGKICDVRKADAPFVVSLPATNTLTTTPDTTSTSTRRLGAASTSTSTRTANAAAVRRVGFRESIFTATVLFIADFLLSIF